MQHLHGSDSFNIVSGVRKCIVCISASCAHYVLHDCRLLCRDTLLRVTQLTCLLHRVVQASGHRDRRSENLIRPSSYGHACRAARRTLVCMRIASVSSFEVTSIVWSPVEENVGGRHS